MKPNDNLTPYQPSKMIGILTIFEKVVRDVFNNFFFGKNQNLSIHATSNQNGLFVRMPFELGHVVANAEENLEKKTEII